MEELCWYCWYPKELVDQFNFILPVAVIANWEPFDARIIVVGAVIAVMAGGDGNTAVS